MRIRPRSIYGALLLTGLTFSLVEGAWASACGPAMQGMDAEMSMDSMHPMDPMDSMESMSSMDSMEPIVGESTSHDCTHQAVHDDSQKQAPDCPFSHFGSAQDCAATISLPAPAPVAFARFSPDGVGYTSQPQAEPHLLLTSTLFHPTKA